MSETLANVGVVDGAGQLPEMIDPTNYAGNSKAEERFRSDILPLWWESRQRRAQMEERWTRYYKIWEGSHTTKYYDGESDLRIRMGRKVIDTLVAQTKGLIWPENQFYKVFGANPVAEQQIPKIVSLMDHDIEQARLKQLTDLMLTTGFTYGFALYKMWWKTRSVTNYRRIRAPQGQIGFEPRKIYTYEGPKVDLVDPMRVYFWPITARNLEDVTAVFEDLEVTRGFVTSMAKKGVYKNVDKIQLSLSSSADNISHDIDSNRDARIQDHGYSPSESSRVTDNRKRLLEVWCNFDLYGTGEDVPCKATMVEDTIVELRQNPLIHQELPYHMWRVTDLMDNIYGQGKLALIEDLQYATDALMNLAIDSLNFQVNPIILFNEDVVDEDSIKIAPRAKWRARDVQRLRDAVEILRPADFASSAFSGLNIVISLLQDLGSAPPLLQGKAGGGDITATEASVLAQGASAFTSSMAAKIEEQLLSPMLQQMYMLEEQFRSAASLARIAGVMKQPIDPQDIVGDYTFRWEVSSAAAQAMQVQAVNGGVTAGPPAGDGEGAGLMQLIQGLGGGGGS